MATPNVGILTNSGKNLIDQVNAGKTKITFSKIVFSSMDNSKLTDDQVKALTAITPQEVVVNSPEATLDANTGETRIRATGNNEALTDGVYVKTYAVYAKDDSGDEILYGITVSPNPNYLPEYDGVTPQAVTYSYKVNISNTSNITFTNSNDIYVSDTDLAEALQPYAKTVDVNQQLDTKVNVSDMRKPASDVAGIEEVNAKQDKIGYTPADDSKVVHSTDTTSWQKQKITADDGTMLVNITSGDLSSTISKLTVGYYTIYCAFGVTNSPSAKALRGFFHVTWQGSDVNVGSGVLIDEDGIAYTVNTLKGPVTYQKMADDSKVVHSTDTSNWQKSKVTNDNGSPLINLNSSNQDLSATLVSLGLGLHTVYASSSVQNNPLKGIASVKGVIDIQGNAYGEGFLIGSKFNNQGIVMYHVWLDGSKANYTQIANDSAVAHLSGANNFDTVPTVNNNPLLLASSLPSDLARTSQQTNFTAGLQSGGVDVATAADLKSIENSAWRPLTLENANNGTILFKDNGDGTALLTGSANFVIAADSGVITEAINPPSGYQFSSLAWNKGVNGDGIFAIGGRSGTSGGSIYTPSALINNGKICFKGGSFSYPELMFSPCLNTTDKTSTSCEPAIVEIKKV